MGKGILLYLNIPFCPKKCPYCHKHTYELNGSCNVQAYLPALEREIRAAAEDLDDHEVKAVWIGGGIAGHIFDRELGTLIRQFPKLFNIEETAEITLKVHPGMVSAETLNACHRAGINRLSIEYVTAIKPEHQALGRFLDPEAMRITDMVLAPGRQKRSFDVLTGIPGQSELSLKKTLQTAIGYRAGHISLYRLDGTGDSSADALAEYAESILRENGFEQYLPDQFARPGEECQFRKYLAEGMEYMGFGPDAETCLDGIHSLNSGHLQTYLQYADRPERIIAKIWSEE
jgi:oxygen-independent coproporphyrinogen-3 oxidase